MTDPFHVAIRRARRRKKLTQVAVAKALGVSQSAVAQWESGRSLPSEEVAPKLAKLLDLDVQQMMGTSKARAATPALPPRARIDVLGLPVAEDSERIRFDGYTTYGQVLAPAQLEDVRGAFAVHIRGSSMEPRYFSGEIVYLDPTRKPNKGDFVLIVVKEPGFSDLIGYVRQFVGEDLTHIHVRKLNPREEQHFRKDHVAHYTMIVGAGLF